MLDGSPKAAPARTGAATRLLGTIVRELDARRTAGFNEEVHEGRHRFRTGPVALQLAEQLRHADQLAAGLFDEVERQLTNLSSAEVAGAAWRNKGEVVVCDDEDALVAFAARSDVAVLARRCGGDAPRLQREACRRMTLR